MERTPSFAKASQFPTATFVYTSGTFASNESASFCSSGRLGQMYGMTKFQQARMHFVPATECSFPPSEYVTLTPFESAGSPAWVTRTADSKGVSVTYSDGGKLH